jgi:hypothetical protein
VFQKRIVSISPRVLPERSKSDFRRGGWSFGIKNAGCEKEQASGV